MPEPTNAPVEKTATTRAALQAELELAPASARDLSARVGLPEKEVAGHLEHLARSLAAHGKRLHVEPAECRRCGFVFRERRRLTRPSRCPSCSSEQIEPPIFSVEG